MPFRFRKSLKIAPGVRMNFGKGGLSSIRLGSTNFGSRGVSQSFSIPGTGLSYQSRIATKQKTRSTQSRKTKQTTTTSAGLTLNDEGIIVFTDAKGKPLSPQMIQLAKKQNRQYIIDWLHERADTFNDATQSLINLHLTTPSPDGEIIVNPKPTPPPPAKFGLMSQIFASQKQKTVDKANQAQLDYQNQLVEWEQLEKAIASDVEVMSGVLFNAFSSIEWPRETSVSYAVVDDGNKVLFDIDLPEVEDMPTKEASANSKDLRLTIKDRSAATIQVDYLRHIHAIGFRLIGDVFAHLKSVNTVVLSGYSQRVDKKTGNTNDEYLYSVRVTRDNWNKLNFDNLEQLDVVSCFETFELRRNSSARGVMTPIEPFSD